MEHEKIVEHIRVSLETVLNRDIPRIDDGTRLFEELTLDSTSVLELLMGLEDTIGLEIDPDELEAEVFQTVGSLSGYVSAQLAKAAA